MYDPLQYMLNDVIESLKTNIIVGNLSLYFIKQFNIICTLKAISIDVFCLCCGWFDLPWIDSLYAKMVVSENSFKIPFYRVQTNICSLLPFNTKQSIKTFLIWSNALKMYKVTRYIPQMTVSVLLCSHVYMYCVNLFIV